MVTGRWSIDDSADDSTDDPADDSDESSDENPLLAGHCISILLSKVTCCREIIPHRDMKTLCLGIRLHQRITNNLSIGLESSTSTYPPVSDQSRYLSSLVIIGLRDWVVCGVDYVTRPELEQ